MALYSVNAPGRTLHLACGNPSGLKVHCLRNIFTCRYGNSLYGFMFFSPFQFEVACRHCPVPESKVGSPQRELGCSCLRQTNKLLEYRIMIEFSDRRCHSPRFAAQDTRVARGPVYTTKCCRQGRP